MKCVCCGREIQDGTKFCIYCGSVQPEKTVMPAAPPVAMPVQQGMPIQQETPVQQTMPMKPGKKKTGLVLGIILGALVVIGLGAWLLFFLLGGGSDDTSSKRDRTEREAEVEDTEESSYAAKGKEEEEDPVEDPMAIPGGAWNEEAQSEADTAERTQHAAADSSAEEPAEESAEKEGEEESAVPQVMTEEEESSSETVVPEPLSAELVTFPPEAHTALTPTGITCSSEFDWVEGGYFYSAASAIDGDLDTNWQEDNGAPAAIDEWLTLIYTREMEIRYIGVWLGYGSGDYGYYANSRPKVLRFTFDNGESVEVTFEDAKDWQYVELSRSVKTTTMTVTILDVYYGNRWTDTAISEILCFAE